VTLGPELQFVDREYVWFNGKRLLYLAGTDYHRMSNDPLIVKTVAEAAGRFGLSPTGSRTTTGNHSLYVRLEEVVSEFFASEGAVAGPSGYLSNMILLQAIESEYDALFIDEQAHSSLVDAANQSGKRMYRFVHLDAQSLEEQLRANLSGNSRPLVLTDGVFPARGEIAPLGEYAEVLKPYDGRILVDDAHAMAVIGKSGKGSWENQGISRDCLYQTGTLSKGFGVAGGIIPADNDLVEAIHSKSLAFVGCTGLSLPLAAAAIQSISYFLSHRSAIAGLQRRSLALKKRFKHIGFSMPETPAPIFSITHRDAEKNGRLSRLLIDNGIYPPFINYPGAPPGGHFRFILTSSTTEDQEESLFQTVASSL
jgi:7-keto-8-aminopelargonate synthetase-like enzyme